MFLKTLSQAGVGKVFSEAKRTKAERECEFHAGKFDNVSLKNTLLSLKSNKVKLFFIVFSCEALGINDSYFSFLKI